jgi:hypothetical protein
VDWPRARAILLAAFIMVNLLLAYSLWSPGGLPGLSAASEPRQIEQLRARLFERGLVLPNAVSVPRSPEPLRFLYVEYRPTPGLAAIGSEFSGKVPPTSVFTARHAWMSPSFDPATQVVLYRPQADRTAEREVRLDNRQQLIQAAEEFLSQESLMPARAVFSAILPQAGTENVLVEFVPEYEGFPIYSGYTRVEVSPRGIETVAIFWVEPRGYTEALPKAVRPASEALLRLAGRLEVSGQARDTIAMIQLGYYAGRSLTVTQTDEIQGWDTVPVWRITLDSGAIYYINALNGEWES